MENILKSEEQASIDFFLKNSHWAQMIRNYITWKDFKVGDILVRYKSDHSGKESVDLVSTECKVPKKFKVVFIDELGCPWVKNVNVRSGLGAKLYCLVDAQRYKYTADPELLDCLIMGHRYDPRAQYRQWRSENPQYGGK